MPNDLEKYFFSNTGRLIHKWLHYFDIYDRHFRNFRGRPITIVEVGVFHGGSLQMWKDYFGRQARIVGIDIDPRCVVFGDEQVEIIIGDQDDRAFLGSLRERVGGVEIFIDDGGHRMSQQIGTFEELWPIVTEGGIYLIEDLHTSYWPEYGGGSDEETTFIEFAKKLIDTMHAWHTRGEVEVDSYTRSVAGMHVYDSVLVFEKAMVSEPSHRMTGHPVFDLPEEHQGLLLRPPAGSC